MVKAGGFGRYQCFTLFMMILSMNGPGLVVYGVAYFELQPPYICTYKVVTENPITPAAVGYEEAFFDLDFVAPDTYTKSCTYETVCDEKAMDTNLIGYEVDKNGEFYLDNWIEQMNLYCTPGEAIGVVGAMAFMGCALACFFLPVLGDLYGRYNVYMMTSLLQLPLYIAALYTHLLGVTYIVTFYFGVALIGRFTCGFVLLTESMCNKSKAWVGTALLVGDVVATLYVTFYLRYISVSVKPIIWVGFALNLFSLIASFWNVESPAWLVSVGEIEKAIKHVKYIGKFNGVTDLQISNLLPDPEPEGVTDDTAAGNNHSERRSEDDIIEENPSEDKKPAK